MIAGESLSLSEGQDPSTEEPYRGLANGVRRHEMAMDYAEATYFGLVS
jgi:hypothetical protein